MKSLRAIAFVPAMLITVTAIITSGCNENKFEEKEVAFAMSDAMLASSELFESRHQSVKNEISLFGKVTADNAKMAQVFPVMSGVVKSIGIELGDYVKQGQVMATIQSSEVASYQKQKHDALNDLALAEKYLQVTRDLFAGKLNSEKDLLAAEKEFDKAKAELDRINEIHSIYQLKNGSVYDITAPISGFVVSKKINQNEQLRSDGGEPVFSIAEINEVWVLANVNESDLAKIHVGYDVEIKTVAFPDVIYKGKIDKIFNAIDPQTRSIKVRTKVPNADLKLKPEMNCTVRVKYLENKRMLAIPSSAIIFDKSKYWVMVFRDKFNVDTRRVEIYRQLGDTTYVSSGIEVGEKVISKNGLLIYDALND